MVRARRKEGGGQGLKNRGWGLTNGGWVLGVGDWGKQMPGVRGPGWKNRRSRERDVRYKAESTHSSLTFLLTASKSLSEVTRTALRWWASAAAKQSA